MVNDNQIDEISLLSSGSDDEREVVTEWALYYKLHVMLDLQFIINAFL